MHFNSATLSFPDSRLPTVSQTPPLNAGPTSTTSTCWSKNRSATWSGRREAGFMLARQWLESAGTARPFFPITSVDAVDP